MTLTFNDLDRLSAAARASPRLRAHMNLHASYAEGCQRLLNAVEPDSYIPPHRHPAYATKETLLALRGRFVLLEFDDSGRVTTVTPFGHSGDTAVICDIAPDVWHTVLSLDAGGVLFEAKEGPFRPEMAKALAPFAPPEGAPDAGAYLQTLKAIALAGVQRPAI